jgi:hypothetical protein
MKFASGGSFATKFVIAAVVPVASPDMKRAIHRNPETAHFKPVNRAPIPIATKVVLVDATLALCFVPGEVAEEVEGRVEGERLVLEGGISEKELNPELGMHVPN